MQQNTGRGTSVHERVQHGDLVAPLEGLTKTHIDQMTEKKAKGRRITEHWDM